MTVPTQRGSGKVDKQEGQLQSIKGALGAGQGSSLGDGELLKILERGSDLMKGVGCLGREIGETIRSAAGWGRRLQEHKREGGCLGCRSIGL